MDFERDFFENETEIITPMDEKLVRKQIEEILKDGEGKCNFNEG